MLINIGIIPVHCVPLLCKFEPLNSKQFSRINSLKCYFGSGFESGKYIEVSILITVVFRVGKGQSTASLPNNGQEKNYFV